MAKKIRRINTRVRRRGREAHVLKATSVLGWHWLSASRKIGDSGRVRRPARRPLRGRGRRESRAKREFMNVLVKPGLVLKLKPGPIEMFGRGLYAARSASPGDAPWRATWLCRVQLSGRILSNGEQYCAQQREVLWMVDVRPIAKDLVYTYLTRNSSLPVGKFLAESNAFTERLIKAIRDVTPIPRLTEGERARLHEFENLMGATNYYCQKRYVLALDALFRIHRDAKVLNDYFVQRVEAAAARKPPRKKK